jgi:hypothetical protein
VTIILATGFKPPIFVNYNEAKIRLDLFSKFDDLLENEDNINLAEKASLKYNSV